MENAGIHTKGKAAPSQRALYCQEPPTLSCWEGTAGLMDAGYKAEQKHKKLLGLQKQIQIKSRLYKEDAVLCVKIQS